MKKAELQKRVDELKWFHQIELPTDDGGSIVTPGIVDHCTEEVANHRYGIPLDMTGKSVLDIGAMNGYHSFLAEKRGANVTAIEPNQGDGDNNRCLQLAKQVLCSKVRHFGFDLCEWVYGEEHAFEYDLAFCFGVLYHCENPIKELRALSASLKTNGVALIETAKSQNEMYGHAHRPFWEFVPGFDNDPTNYWYPTYPGLRSALLHVGFKEIEIFYNDGIRMSVKAFK